MRSLTPLLCVGLAAPALAQNPRPSVLVDTTTLGTAIAPNVASEGDLSVITYSDNAVNEIYSVASDADGIAWGTPVRVDRDTTASAKFVGFQNGNESIAIHGSHVYITWRDDRNAAFDDVYFNRSTDGGVSYEALDQRLDNSSLAGVSSVRDWSQFLSRDPGGDPNLDSIYVLMAVEVTSGGPEDLFLVASHDGGASFSAAMPASTANGSGSDVDNIGIAAVGLNVVWTWVDDRLGADDQWVAVSTDGGATFSETTIDVNAGADNTGESVDVAMDATGVVAISFGDRSSGAAVDELWVATATAFGTSGFTTSLVGNYTFGVTDTDNGEIELSGANIVVAWEDNRTGGDEIWTAFSSDLGATWSADVQLSTSGAGFPRFTHDGGPLVVAWTGGAFPEDAFAAWSLDDGATWNVLPGVVSDTTADTDFTEVALNGATSNVIFSWLADDTSVNRVYAGGFALCGPAAEAFRNGGSNPASYTSNAPVLGGTFNATVDLSTTGHALAVVVGFASPFNFTLGGGQTVLVNPADPSGELLGLAPQAGPLAGFASVVPNLPGLCNFTLSTQAVHFGAVSPFALSNAQDLTVGGF